MHGRNSVPVCNKRRTLLWRSKFGAVPPQERSTSQQSYLRELPPSLLTNAKRKKKRRRNRLVYNGESCTRNCTAKRRPVRYVGRYISSGRAINETGLVASVNAEEGGGENSFSAAPTRSRQRRGHTGKVDREVSRTQPLGPVSSQRRCREANGSAQSKGRSGEHRDRRTPLLGPVITMRPASSTGRPREYALVTQRSELGIWERARGGTSTMRPTYDHSGGGRRRHAHTAGRRRM